MEAEVRTETYGAVAEVDSVADGVNHKCLDLAEVTAEVTVEAWAVSADSQEWVAADMAVASEVDTECLRCLDLVEDSVVDLEEECLDLAEASVEECPDSAVGSEAAHVLLISKIQIMMALMTEIKTNGLEEDGNDCYAMGMES